jgi:CBS domain containing-hemolysin-like protein
MSKQSDFVERKTTRQRLSSFFRKLWRITSPREQDTSIRNAIEELIEEDNGDDGQSIDNDEKIILSNVLSLKELTAEDLMIPYANIVALPITASQAEVLSTFANANVSQIPVYSETVDNIVGLLCLKDVISWLQELGRKEHDHDDANSESAKHDANSESAKCGVIPSLKSILREILYIAPTMRVLDLLLQMRENCGRLAVVVDEFGGVAGIVTFALLIENIVGKIQYEDNSISKQVEILPNGVIILNAGTGLDELDDTLDKLYGLRINWMYGLNDEDVDTIGGLVTLVAERVPIRGELIVHPLGFEFENLDAVPRRVIK